MQALRSIAFLLPVLAPVPGPILGPGLGPILGPMLGPGLGPMLGRGLGPGPARGEDEAALMLRLRDGSIHWGTIRAHDPDGIEFVRLENGGVARFPWALLDASQEEELRRRWGYLDESGEEFLIEADRLLLSDGREVVGRILSRTDDAILVKTAGATIPVPKSRVASAATTVQVPALEVYTREELYSQELVRAMADDAASQFALAQFCERILDFGHALEHYQEARRIDPSYRAEDLGWALERVRAKAERQDQVDYLAQVDLAAARKKFDEALKLAEAFFERYPDSPLFPDAKRRIDRVEKARERALRELVARQWHAAASRLARNAAGKTFEEVLAYLDETMSEEVLAQVVAEAGTIQPEIEPDQVRKLWSEREGLRWRIASYGHGTWLIGEDAALAGLEDEKEAPEEVTTQKDAERLALEDRIERFLKNQELVRKAKTSEAKSEEREETWLGLSSTARSQWILAYYAENSGDMEVKEKPAFRLCTECGGKGVREIVVTSNVRSQPSGQGGQAAGGGIHKIPCPTCHGLGLIRRIYYR